MKENSSIRNNSYPLRMPKSLVAEVKEIALQDGTSLNQFICCAVAEKMSAMRAVRYIEKKAEKADEKAFYEIMAKTGNNPPIEGDEII